MPNKTSKGIGYIVEDALRDYFSCLDGQKPTQDLYAVMMDQVEKPLLRITLSHVEGNQTKAAHMLGINRNTLRKKLKQHGLDESTI